MGTGTNTRAETLIVENGLFFDGRGGKPAVRHLRIRDGRVEKISATRFPHEEGARVIDARGKWVMPGFIDVHTHYDAEVELEPSLGESLRHGVTTVFLGSCSLSVAVGDPDDLTDQFTRVEAIPEAYLRPLIREKKTWETVSEYVEHLDGLPLGPNVTTFVGYSAVRSHVLGLERSLDPKEKPSGRELARMKAIVNEGLDAGCVGLSTNTLYWDKMGGDRFRSRCLPSTYASWGELSEMVELVRARDLVYQTIPNVSTKYEIVYLAAFSAGLGRRAPLKTSVVSIMDLRSNRLIYKALQRIGRFINGPLRGNFRFQALPVPFDLYADGFDIVVFEEFGAGAAALHVNDAIERRNLFRDSKYRAWFRRQWRNPFIPKVFHRNFGMAEIKECPDARLVGRTFEQVARERGQDVVDTFFDLVVEHGEKLRWYTVVGNDRFAPLASILDHDTITIGFSDAGAHLRNMAFYNFPLRMLKFVRDAERAGRPVMPIERAVHRLTGELGEWYGIDAGTLREGGRADVVIVDPERLDHELERMHEAKMEGFGDRPRLVRRNPAAVPAVIVNGRLAVENGEPLPEVGRTRGYGRFLRAL
ncbi:MAG: amidohydrolase family protein [Myxococcales bacterium]|nr:amidohydrolase family protein [Myxococcales bacterium]